ncbi:Rid family detoxifying hydrolase [Petroclostridium sp. X23]|uniref:RidA family protein n=1 Tax=Petroclostridium sp. X23 TaxID=3045146 RepID=UPI0024AD5EBB|nr:Rid family detoxifying hydrolase [Petroclostridium sp. X23]WHH61266.1 Rid family detoxifying hydrolase [Petroclostridium sp. X23]
MNKIKVTTSKAPNPGGWYSQAFRAGDMIYTAGVTAADPVTQQIVAPGDIVRQTEQVLENMEEILKAAGSDLEHVIKTTVFISDLDMFEEYNETYKKFFPVDPPARSTMEIGKFNNGMVIEIEAIAIAKD